MPLAGILICSPVNIQFNGILINSTKMSCILPCNDLLSSLIDS